MVSRRDIPGYPFAHSLTVQVASEACSESILREVGGSILEGWVNWSICGPKGRPIAASFLRKLDLRARPIKG